MLSQGFIARNAQGDTVLLGRGGSDTSGAYLAGKLEARRLEIWTDAPGFFSADPKAVPSARLIKSLHYREAQEIASAGGGILHPRSISPVRATGIPLYLKCTPHPEWEGSVISNAPGDDQPQLKAISHRTGITLVSMESMEMWHQVGFLADAFNVFREHGISVDLISTSESNVTVSIDTAQNVTTRAAIEALADDLRKLCKVTIISDCAAITLVGQRIRTILHELAPVLEVFQEQQVHLVTQAANDLNLTFVVNSEHAYRLVQHLHGLLVDKFAGGVFGETWERLTGGGTPAKTVPKPWWVKKKAQLLEIGAQRDATYVYDRESIESAIAALRGLKAVDAVFYAMKANPNREILKLVHDGGLNIECVSPGELARVLEVLPAPRPQAHSVHAELRAARGVRARASSRASGSRSTICFRCGNGRRASRARRSSSASTRARAAATTSTCARPACIRSSAFRCSRSTSSSKRRRRPARASSVCTRIRAAACWLRARGSIRADSS